MNPRQNQDVGSFGGGRGAQIWHDAMLPILSKEPAVPFPPAGIPVRMPAPPAAPPAP